MISKEFPLKSYCNILNSAFCFFKAIPQGVFRREPFGPHVLYRIDRPKFLATEKGCCIGTIDGGTQRWSIVPLSA